MNTVPDEPRQTWLSLQEEADALVRRVRSSMSARESARTLEQWGMASAAHGEALARAQRAWDEIRMVGEVYRARQAELARSKAQARADVRSGLDTQSRSNARSGSDRESRWSAARPARVSRRLFLGTGLAAAGAAAVAVAVRPPWDLWPSLSEMGADYRTATGEQRHVIVAENVAVELNTQTSLDVTRGADGDEVRLIAGEAAFSRDGTGKAVEVVAGAGRMPVGACGFEVRRLSGGGVSVTCVQGDVPVRHPAGTVVLRPNQQVRYDDSAMSEIHDVNPATASAWRRGMLVFRDTPLAAVIDEVNRYRPGRVVLMNDALGRRVLNGQFQIASLDQVILHLEDVFGAHVRSLPGGVMLVS